MSTPTEERPVLLVTQKLSVVSGYRDVSLSRKSIHPFENKNTDRSSVAAGNIAVTKAFATHPKVLIAALNGPVIGLSAALIAHCDLI